MSTQHDAGTLGRQVSWLSMLAFSVPPMFCVLYLKDAPKHKEGYETVPLSETERGSMELDDDDPRRAKATGTDI